MRYFFVVNKQTTASGCTAYLQKMVVAKWLWWKTYSSVKNIIAVVQIACMLIDYDNGLASFIGRAGMKFTAFYYDSEEFEVVGNIHDNPELLRGNDNAER